MTFAFRSDRASHDGIIVVLESCKLAHSTTCALFEDEQGDVQVRLKKFGGFKRDRRAMAEWVAGLVGGVWPVFAPSIGALGAFIAGSNTIRTIQADFIEFLSGGQAPNTALSPVSSYHGG